MALTVMSDSSKPELTWEVSEIIELIRVVFPLSTYNIRVGHFDAIERVRTN